MRILEKTIHSTFDFEVEELGFGLRQFTHESQLYIYDVMVVDIEIKEYLLGMHDIAIINLDMMCTTDIMVNFTQNGEIKTIGLKAMHQEFFKESDIRNYTIKNIING